MSYDTAFELRDRLDDLDQVLGMVSTLMEPAPLGAVVDRGQLSVTLGILNREARCAGRMSGADLSECIDALGSLLTPELDLHIVNRESLATLLSVLIREYRAAHKALFDLGEVRGLFPRPEVVMAAGATPAPGRE